MKPVLARLGALPLLLAGASAAEFHICSTGNDSNAGTEDKPFRSFHKAQEAVRAINGDMSGDINVFIAPNTYVLHEPLHFTAEDSGSNGHRVVWQAQDMEKGVNISGGLQLTDWEVHDEDKNIFVSTVPEDTQARHLFVNQQHATRARKELDRAWLQNNTDGFWIVNQQAEFLLDMPGLGNAEIRGKGGFTDRSVPIARSGENKTLIMQQPAWANNGIGYDTLPRPDSSHGLWVENALALLDEENEWFLDTAAGKLYYKPIEGAAIEDLYIVLGNLEQLLIIEGTYDEPAHDMSFKGFHYMHTTWNLPSSSVGFADQQTGAFIGQNRTYEHFEETRAHWYQIPGSVQASAVKDITFQNGSMTAIMGGFGIGNDANAHASGIGLGALNVEISGMYFTETGANAISIGGVQADAHHPSDERMVNKNNRVLENIFTRIARTYTSTIPVLVTYTQNSQVVHNDIYDVPYSGICYGYGWGSNDEGGSDEYERRGLYKYQPRYDTPTIMKGGYIANNVIHKFGQLHSDLGAIYTLSKSPDTTITENWVFDSTRGGAVYHDEGSRDYVVNYCVFETREDWLWRNERPLYTTGNLTLHDIVTNHTSSDGTNEWGDRVYNTTQFSSYSEDLTPEQKAVVREAGIPIPQRDGRPISVDPEDILNG